jgi:hypothetical protein
VTFSRRIPSSTNLSDLSVAADTATATITGVTASAPDPTKVVGSA